MGKIFLISNMWPSKDSPGYGSFVKNVAEELEVSGWSIGPRALISGRPKGAFSKLGKYLSFYYHIAKGFFGKYDFIYIHFPNQAIPILKLLYGLRKPKIVINFHGEDLLYKEEGYLGKLGKMAEKFCKRYADAVVVPSSYYADIVAERHLIERSKIIVSPSGGISEEIFYPEPDENVDVYDGSRPIKISYVGRLEKEKGILTFLDVLKLLTNKSIKYDARIVGYGSLHDQVASFINDSKLENVTLISGMPQTSLGAHYREMDLIIFPSMNESLGLVGIESMACGTPVIGSAVGGIKTYLSDEDNGFLVAPGDYKSIAEKIQKYAEMSRSEKLEMRKECIKTGRDFYKGKVCAKLSEQFIKL